MGKFVELHAINTSLNVDVFDFDHLKKNKLWSSLFESRTFNKKYYL